MAWPLQVPEGDATLFTGKREMSAYGHETSPEGWVLSQKPPSGSQLLSSSCGSVTMVD